jgi:hypothetical protein
MSVNPTFIDFCNKLARVESINSTAFHDEAEKIMGYPVDLSLSLYKLKTQAITTGIPQWKEEGREVFVTRYRYGGEGHDFIFVVEVKSLDLKRTFKFHFFDYSGEYVESGDVHHSKSDKNKANSQLPFEDLKWLRPLIDQANSDITEYLWLFRLLDTDIDAETLSDAKNYLGDSYGIDYDYIRKGISCSTVTLHEWYDNSMQLSVFINKNEIIYQETQTKGDFQQEITGSENILNFLVDLFRDETTKSFVAKTLKKLFKEMKIKN